MEFRSELPVWQLRRKAEIYGSCVGLLFAFVLMSGADAAPKTKARDVLPLVGASSAIRAARVSKPSELVLSSRGSGLTVYRDLTGPYGRQPPYPSQCSEQKSASQ